MSATTLCRRPGPPVCEADSPCRSLRRGLEPGGCVTPGDTPPDADQTSGLSHPQPMHSRAGAVVWIVDIGVVVLAIALLLVARVLNLA
ncbi:MAG: DUF6480 family protein [Nocardiaceae bacterium]|nr:DUF6480 family protein [Nocardiaceae bacterium]